MLELGSVRPGERVFCCWLAEWVSLEGKEDDVGDAIVVVRKFMLVVSAEGGGGRGAWRLARQRKHSPVP